jgi:ABC-type sugar transport system substrate-binding protein
MDTVATEVTKAEALRALADWVEAHPDIKVLITANIYAGHPGGALVEGAVLHAGRAPRHRVRAFRGAGSDR